ncbi:MAG: protein-tyrosine-phosphatase [Saprospiraceae bacterium]|nr:protein-tyrosine-phosphatase [Saprospiraceae bacterium]
MKINEKLQAYCTVLESEFSVIPETRKQELAELGDYISKKRKAGEETKLTVICTHNSRRSHIGQLWLAAAAIYYGVNGVSTYSGGTEATAFNPRAVAAMRRAGFVISGDDMKSNPHYEASMGEGVDEITLFSKKYDDPANPQQGFAAIMVCSDADEACPFIPGAEKRFAIRYDDPKASDGTPAEAATYDERCRQIGREMLFAMRHATKWDSSLMMTLNFERRGPVCSLEKTAKINYTCVHFS